MNIKTVVKVMNFHALLRVERAHREADKYKLLEQEVAHMIDIIQNNRNLILDRWVLIPDKKAPRLRIYFGSDLGFCGAVNVSVNSELEKEDPKNTVIVIGRKIHDNDLVDFSIPRDEFESRYSEIEAYLIDAVRFRRYSGIDVFYERYYNMSHIEPFRKTIFPIALERRDEESYNEDFMIEGRGVDELMQQLIVTYLNYEIKGAAVNAFAAENILRQNATNESLKRIDEMEEEARRVERKELNQLAAEHVIDSFIKSKVHEE